MVTVPFGPDFKDDDPGRPYFMRVYDRGALAHRLVGPSGLTLDHIDYFGDRFLSVEGPWTRFVLKFRPLLDWLTPFPAAIFMGTVPPTSIRAVGGACLTLTKR